MNITRHLISSGSVSLTTSPRTNRVGCLRHNPSGRLSQRGRIRSMSMPCLRCYAYQTVPGRSGWPSRDPIGERGALNLYGFVINEPLEHYDILGLNLGIPTCGYGCIAPPMPPMPPPVKPNSDTSPLVSLFEKAVNDYCAQKIRCNCPNLGNIWITITFGATTYKGCYWQAVDMHKRLLDGGAASDWTLDTPSKTIPPHNWVTAESGKYTVSMDTWKGCISVHYKDGSLPDQTTCYKCKDGKAVKK